MYRILLLSAIIMIFGCVSIDDQMEKVPKGIAFESAHFGEITKRKEKRVGNPIVIDYPNRISICVNEGLDSLSKLFSAEASGFMVYHRIITKDSVKWSFESFTSIADITRSGYQCFGSHIYHPNDPRVPKEKLVRGNIASYSCDVDVTYLGERRRLFSGKTTVFDERPTNANK